MLALLLIRALTFPDISNYNEIVNQEVEILVQTSITPLADGAHLCKICGTVIKQMRNLKRHMRDRVSLGKMRDQYVEAAKFDEMFRDH